MSLGEPGWRELCPPGICAKDMPGAFQKGIQPKNGNRHPSPMSPPVCPDSQERDHWKTSGRHFKQSHRTRHSHEGREVTITRARPLSPRSQAARLA